MTPLRAARKSRGWTLEDVVTRLDSVGCQFDNGNLSRLERGIQRASAEVAESLCLVYRGSGINEMHVLYPERYQMVGVSNGRFEFAAKAGARA